MAINGTERYLQIASRSRFPISGQIDPTHNDNDNSSKDGNYLYNPSKQGAQEPVTTDSSDHQSSQPITSRSFMPKGALRLQAVLANRMYARNGNNPPQTRNLAVGSFPPQSSLQSNATAVNVDSANPQNNSVTTSNHNNSNPQNKSEQWGMKLDNSGNLYVAQDLLGYKTPMSAEEQIKLVDQYEKKKFNRDALYAGLTNLGASLGGTSGKWTTKLGSYG